jgi:hypothetical protein
MPKTSKKLKISNLQEINGQTITEEPKSGKKHLIESTGKVEEPIGEKYQPTTLEQVWGGANHLARYNTLKQNEYYETLASMNRPDLEREARRIHIPVVEQTDRLIDNLKKEFNAFLASLKIPKTIKTHSKISKEAQSILNEGK